MRSVDRVPIPQQILWRRVPWKCLYNLLGSPLGRRVGCHIEMNGLPAVVAEDYQHEQDPESGGRNCEEIYGNHARYVIFQERRPHLGWRLGNPTMNQAGNRSLGDLDSQLEQLAMNPWCAPKWIGHRHFFTI